MPSKLKKLYIAVAAAAPTTVGILFRRFYAFNLTQTDPLTTVASDKYGNFLQDFAPISAGVDALTKAKNAVTAVFQPGGHSHIAHAAVALDFIAATGSATVANSIDPVTTRNFRLRAIVSRVLAFSRVTLDGNIYVQRQHSIEV